MSLSLLFLFGYLLGMVGSGFIVAGPIRRVLGFETPAAHADPETSADADIVLCAVVVGVAALWPLTLGLYYASRFTTASVD